MTEVFEEATVRAGDREVRYLVGGEGKPLVVLHGGGGLHIPPGPVFDELAGHSKLYLIEMPGWGGTSSEGIETLVDLADSIDEVTESLGLDDYDLLGTSIGGAVALWHAVRSPKVSRLVLEAPAAFREGAPAPGDPIPPEAMTTNKERLEMMRQRPPQPAAGGQSLPEKLLGNQRNDPALLAALKTYPVPTLVLLGEFDGIIGPQYRTEYEEHVPGVKVQIVADAAHMVSGDQPEAFIAAVTQFLDSK